MNRAEVERLLGAALEGVEPSRLVAAADRDWKEEEVVVAIGKAAPAMTRGLASQTKVRGICISDHVERVPEGVELFIGDHPIPGARSFEAGRRALEIAEEATICLLSGGGSALVESPIPGVDPEFLAAATRELLESGLPIDQMNLVRTHLSKLKCGGLGPIDTLVLSDVGGHPPGVVSSGPTTSMARQPETAIDLLSQLVEVEEGLAEAIRFWRSPEGESTRLTVVGDGHTACQAVVDAVSDGFATRVEDRWLQNNVADEVVKFFDEAEPGLNLIAGEPTVHVTRGGTGGRNCHAALTMANLIQGTQMIFAALATDGRDGPSGFSGANVDGTTIARGGDPHLALETFDSATFLERTGDALPGRDTGTNVADLWLLWKPQT